MAAINEFIAFFNQDRVPSKSLTCFPFQLFYQLIYLYYHLYYLYSP